MIIFSRRMKIVPSGVTTVDFSPKMSANNMPRAIAMKTCQ
ncbi:uncharacterized protein METZ01_LOCUS129512 [marine metagenome]|uniref:Uncharacterized protein n=1 Tax=marine metagenome TaxID=408172 RepID=A0A381YHV4_9ZZZZ